MPNFNFVGHDLKARAFFGQICEVGAGLAISHKRTLPNLATGKTGTYKKLGFPQIRRVILARGISLVPWFYN